MTAAPAPGLADNAALRFPFAEPPPFGEPSEIAPGLHWLRMPLGGRLDHVNNWLLESDEGWTLIDCGLNNAQTAEIWERLFAGLLRDRPVARIIATHAHVDHIGYLGRLAEITGAPVVMTLAEFLTATVRIGESNERMVDQARQSAFRCGCPSDVIEAMSERRRTVRDSYSGIPLTYRRVIAGQRTAAGGRDWGVLTFGGHSPEMLCLHDPKAGLLIAGDQVLTQITPSINVHPTEPDGDPLGQFYASFPALRRLPADTFVLPSHGMPFYGLHERVGQFETHHAARLDKILSFVEDGSTAYEISLKTFPRAMGTPVARQAMAETLAHLHYLGNHGRLTSEADAQGIVRFRRTEVVHAAPTR